MFLFLRIERLGEHLGSLKVLIDNYQRNDPKFIAAALAWLTAAEKVMSELRLPEGSEMSSLRSRILRVPDAATGDEARARSAVRRAQNVAANESLERAEVVLRQIVVDAEQRLERFEEKLAEGMTDAIVAGAIPPRQAVWMDWLRQVWQCLVQFQETRALTTYLAASLSGPDRLFILDRVLARLSDKGNAPPPA
ncbi:hypothetical protein [Pendulispora albinea]|uniref:Uncharacterized protein n=1 Tax=Pendulispora albinea TaxID=2741071 RepID=A0ABZ2MA17_9BACT